MKRIFLLSFVLLMSTASMAQISAYKFGKGLHIYGADSAKFLQGMTTNDVIKNIYSYNYLLTNQGRYLFDFFVYQQNAESYFIDIDQASVDTLFKRLMMYKLRSNLEIKNIQKEKS